MVRAGVSTDGERNDPQGERHTVGAKRRERMEAAVFDSQHKMFLVVRV